MFDASISTIFCDLNRCICIHRGRCLRKKRSLLTNKPCCKNATMGVNKKYPKHEYPTYENIRIYVVRESEF